MTFTGCEYGAVVPAKWGGVGAAPVAGIDFDTHVDRRVVENCVIWIEFSQNISANYSRVLKSGGWPVTKYVVIVMKKGLALQKDETGCIIRLG